MKKVFACVAAMCIVGGLALSAWAADPYVESDGTQGVVLDYHVNPKTKIVVDFTFLSPLTKQWRLFGAEGSSEVIACIYISNGNVYSWSWKNGSGNYTWTYVPVTADRRTITLDGPNKFIEVVKDGVVETNKAMSAVTATSSYPLGLFGDTTDKYGSTVANKCKSRIYSFKIYEDDALVMDLEPWTDGNGTYALKDVLSGTVYPPMSGGNPFAGGGDFAYTSEQFTWTGAESTDWNEAGNWQVDGAVASWPPQYGDAVSIAAGSTVMIGDAVGSATPLALSGGGTVTLSGHQTRPLATSLSVETGTSLSLDGTVYVMAASYGGAAVAAGRYAAGDLPWLAGSGMLVVGNPGALVENGVLILDVPAGKSIAYYTQLASPITKVVKLGAGTAIVSNDNNSAWVGTVDIKEGFLEAQSAATASTATIPVFGRRAANTITVYKGAQLRVRVPSGTGQTNERFQNNLVLAGEGPDGFGALRLFRSAGGTHLDRLFTNVTLTDDATVYGSSRMGFSSGTVNLNGHTLSHRARPGGSGEFMFNTATATNGHVVAKNSSYMTTQGSFSLRGTADDTLTVEKGSYFSMYNTDITRWDWTLVQKDGSQLRAGAGTTAERNKILGPIVLESGTVTVTNYAPNNTSIRMNLAGPISGAGKMFHNGSGHAYLMNGTNTWTGGLQAKWGTVWGTTTGSIPHGQIRASGSGTINFVAKDWDHAALHNVLTNWDGNGAVNVYTASGENVTDSTAFEYATYYRHGGPGTLTFTADTTPDGATKLFNGEGEMVVAGNKTRRLTRLNVTGGTMTLENAGYIWCGTWDVANDAPKGNVTWTVGGTNTNAPAKMIIKSGSTLDAFVPSGNNTASYFHVQDTGTKGAILEVHEGGAITNWIGVAHGENTKGALYQYGGNVRNLCHAGYDGYVGRYANSYGYVDLMGGHLAMRGWWRFGGDPTAVGVMRMTGGTFKADNCMVLGFGGWGELYMTGGTYHGGTYSHLGEQQYGFKGGDADTIRGLLTLGGEGNPTFTITSYLYVCERTNTFFGAVNMNAGVLSTPYMQKSSWNKSLRDNEKARAFINFGGGAWQAYAGNANIFGSGVQKVNRVTVFPGGATLDINGKSSSNGTVPFEKPFGKGVASITWPEGTVTNGYIGPPEVYITGGGGTGAVAHCTFDARTGTLGEIVMGSPGWGYTEAPTATIKSADRKTTIACAVTMTDGEEQPSGGLTLTNSSATAGTFTLSSANTYPGATVVAGGTLKLGAADAIPSANEVRLAGGTFDASTYDVSYARVGGYGTLKGNVTVTDKLVFDAAQPVTPGLTVNGTLNVANGVTVEIANTNLLTRGVIHTLATFPTPLASVPVSNLTRPWCVFLTNGGRTLKMCYQEGTAILLK